MRKIGTIAAYIWALACLMIIPISFIKNDVLTEQLARLPFMKIHPKYSGGPEIRAYPENGLNIIINEPVYGGIRGRGQNGFVQIRFSGKKLPASIQEIIDYDFDKRPDFEVTINTINGVTELARLNDRVRSLDVSSKVRDDWVIRVNIAREQSKNQD